MVIVETIVRWMVISSGTITTVAIISNITDDCYGIIITSVIIMNDS